MKDHDLKRDQLAVCLMVMDEWGEGEDPNLHVPFFANFLAKQRDTEHSGDCRKEPWSCSRCICDEYLKKADHLLSTFPVLAQSEVYDKVKGHAVTQFDEPLGFRTNDVPDPYKEGPQSDEPCHGPQDTYCPSCGLGGGLR
jgi:hypothetical protein